MKVERSHDLYKRIIKTYWEYYLQIESEFLLTRRYVNFSTENFQAFSIEYLKLYQAICSEIDVIGKAMAQIADSTFTPEDRQNNIMKWWYVIQDAYFVTEGPLTPINNTTHPVRIALGDYECRILDEYDITPWKSFRTEQRPRRNGAIQTVLSPGCSTPKWWSDYNKVKHNRTSFSDGASNFSKANLGNVSKALAALYVLERALIDTVGTKEDLQSFMEFSQVFIKRRRRTYTEMDQLYGID